MRDILDEVELHLNDNSHMKSHALVSALANEIVKLRAELETAKKYPTVYKNTNHRGYDWNISECQHNWIYDIDSRKCSKCGRME